MRQLAGYAYNPGGAWTGVHQMSIDGKRDNFSKENFVALAAVGGIKKRKAIDIAQEVSRAVANWSQHAEAAGIDPQRSATIARSLRNDIL